MIVVVTGGATSLGLAVSRRFEKAGATVYALDVSADAVAALAGEKSITGMQVDCLDPGAVGRAFEEILGRHGAVDVLVNNVGLPGPRGPLEECSIEDWERSMKGGIGAAFYCSRLVIPAMKQRRSGCIVNVSTASVKTGLPNRTPYVVTKAAVEAFTTNLARELGPFNVRVNAVRPGALDNPRLDRIIRNHAEEKGMTFEETEAMFMHYVSMRSRVSLEEVAEGVYMACSPDIPHFTGQVFAVDGNAEWEE